MLLKEASWFSVEWIRSTLWESIPGDCHLLSNVLATQNSGIVHV